MNNYYYEYRLWLISEIMSITLLSTLVKLLQCLIALNVIDKNKGYICIFLVSTSLISISQYILFKLSLNGVTYLRNRYLERNSLPKQKVLRIHEKELWGNNFSSKGSSIVFISRISFFVVLFIGALIGGYYDLIEHGLTLF